MKFLCDQMLAKVGRWLRAAGYDTEIIDQPLPDQIILKQALDSHRLLLTRDRHFLEMKNSDTMTVIWLKANDLQSCIQELSEKLPINWTNAPFSRCLLCNHFLEEIGRSQIRQDIPEDIKVSNCKLWLCSRCNKIYWEGSHTKRMLQQLTEWQATPHDKGPKEMGDSDV